MSTTTSSPSTTRTGTRSSASFTPSSVTVTSTDSTAGFPFSSTFTEPPPISTSRGNVNSGGNPNGGGIAASANLYLYTFLATLVLLLSVSAAIIMRSLLLRRRHRRMVDEAIRNGTWVPPSPGGPFGLGGRGGRVDPGLKPKLFESYIGGSEKEQMHANVKHTTQTEWDWDSIRPFSATYVNPQQSSSMSLQPNGSPPIAPDGSTLQIPPPLTYTRRAFRFLRPHRDSATQYPLNPRSTASAVNLPTTPLGTGAADAGTPSAKKVRVAVLIAMPHPPTESPGSRSKSPSPAPGPSSSSAAPLSALPEDDEEELPHLEFGVAELDVHDADHAERSKGDAPRKDGGRASGSGSMDKV